MYICGMGDFHVLLFGPPFSRHFKSTPVCFPTCSVVKQYLKLPKKFPLNLYSLEVSLNCQSDILFNLSRTVVLVWYTEF